VLVARRRLVSVKNGAFFEFGGKILVLLIGFFL